MTARPSSDPANPPKARALRRQAKLAQPISRWWQSVSESARQPHYNLQVIATATRCPSPALGPALKALGWLAVQTRIDGAQQRVWVPPGYPNPQRHIGRPRSR